MTDNYDSYAATQELRDFLTSVKAETEYVNQRKDMAIIRTRLCENLQKFPLRSSIGYFVLIEDGEGEIEIDLEKYELKPNTLIFLGPKRYVTDMKFHRPITVTLFSFNPVLVESMLPKLISLIPGMLSKKLRPVFLMTQEQSETTMRWVDLIDRKMQQEEGPFTKGMLICILYAFSMEMMEFQAKEAKTFGKHNHKDDIVAKFLLCVSENFKEERRVDFYADKMCLSSKHLSAVVKEVTGKTAGDWIDIYVILEAKVLLRTTSLTIQQISDRLHFANQSFFGKYFKRLTGKTPSAYRL